MDKEFIDNILLELLNKAHEIYGERVEKIWFYDREFCPCCNKRRIDALKMGEDLALSLNGFMYREMNALIGYSLCSYCVTDVVARGDKHNELYQNLEENLKSAYHKHIKLHAS